MHWIHSSTWWWSLSLIQIEKITNTLMKHGIHVKIMNQSLMLESKHEMLQVQWTLHILIERLLEIIWPCKVLEINSKND
jgi:hypothetical protein